MLLYIRTRQHEAKKLDFLLHLICLNLYYLRDPRKEIDKFQSKPTERHNFFELKIQ